VNLIFLIHQFEKLVVETDRFRRSQNQIAAGVERVMKLRDAALVQIRTQIDEDVAAADQVEPRERWIGAKILPREGADIAHATVDLITAIALNKKTLQPGGRNVLFDRAGINSQPGMLDHRFAQIGAKN